MKLSIHSGLTNILALTSASLFSLHPDNMLRPRQDEPYDMCARQTYSAIKVGMTAPTLNILQILCLGVCDSARQSAQDYLTMADCVWNNRPDVAMESFYLTRWKRCTEQCTQETIFEGDCGCNLDANMVWVIEDEDVKEGCDSEVVAPKAFAIGGWSNNLNTETPATHCHRFGRGLGDLLLAAH